MSRHCERGEKGKKSARAYFPVGIGARACRGIPTFRRVPAAHVRGSSPGRLLHQVVREGVADQLGIRLQIELLHDSRFIGARRLRAEVELFCDRLQGLSGSEQEEYLALTVGEQLVQRPAGAVAEGELLGELRTDVPSPRGDLSQRREQLLGLAVLC